MIMLFNLAQAQEFDPVAKAFEKGNAAELRKYLASTIELSIDGEEMEVGRGDAENQIRSFFDSHPPKSFSVLHSGVSDSDVKYMIGSYLSSNGGFRVSVYMRKEADKYVIQSLEVEAN